MSSSSSYCEKCETTRTGSLECPQDDCPHPENRRHTKRGDVFMREGKPHCGTCGTALSNRHVCNIDGCPHGLYHDKGNGREDLEIVKELRRREYRDRVTHGVSDARTVSEQTANRQTNSPPIPELEARNNTSARFTARKREYDIREMTKRLVVAGLPFLHEAAGSNGYVVGYGDSMKGYVRAMHRLAEETVDTTEEK